MLLLGIIGLMAELISRHGARVRWIRRQRCGRT